MKWNFFSGGLKAGFYCILSDPKASESLSILLWVLHLLLNNVFFMQTWYVTMWKLNQASLETTENVDFSRRY